MKRCLLLAGSFFLLLAAVMAAASYSPAWAAGNPDVPKGAALYDNWFAALGKSAPEGNMLLWSKQSTNTRSGPDTWRCVECHGWDYQGKDGAYREGNSRYTGFPGVLQVSKTLSQEDLLGVLKGSQDKAHDFSAYIDDASLKQLVVFLKTSLINDDTFINPQTFKVVGGDIEVGKTLYNQSCTSCHGENGLKIAFRFEGMDAGLSTLAALDPWRFLHKTRFGTPGTPMVIGYDLGWTEQEGRNMLLYAQSMPGGTAHIEQLPVIGEGEVTPEPLRGGPPQGFLGGILTALGAIATGLGFNILVAAVLVGILLLIVWAIRPKRK
jgi:cytochrome c553